MRKQAKRPPNQAGFTLVELMVAMVVLAIGIMATIAMQYTALAGYTASREMTGATEVARTVEQRLKTEALGWRLGETPNSVSPYSGEPGLLGSLDETAWAMVYSDPVSVRYGEGNGPQRFCAFVRGGSIVVTEIPALQFVPITIAVVYPAANGQFPGVSAGNPWGSCAAINDEDIVPGDRIPLEEQGMRVTFYSTSVRPMR